jgi:hypothetical protein
MKGQKAVGISMSLAESSIRERHMLEAVKSLISRNIAYLV